MQFADALYFIDKEITMKTLSAFSITIVTTAALLAGCADMPSNQQNYPSQNYSSQNYPSQNYRQQGASYGTVDRIELVRSGDSNNVAGTIIGGIIGGVIGHQIGSGNGNTAATVAGAAGGAYVGNQVQQRRRNDNEAFRVTVRMDNGSYQTITEDNITDLRTGDRVRLDSNGLSRY